MAHPFLGVVFAQFVQIQSRTEMIPSSRNHKAFHGRAVQVRKEQLEPADDRKIDRIPLLRPVQERDADIVMQFCRHSRREIVEIAFHG